MKCTQLHTHITFALSFVSDIRMVSVFAFLLDSFVVITTKYHHRCLGAVYFFLVQKDYTLYRYLYIVVFEHCRHHRRRCLFFSLFVRVHYMRCVKQSIAIKYRILRGTEDKAKWDKRKKRTVKPYQN